MKETSGNLIGHSHPAITRILKTRSSVFSYFRSFCLSLNSSFSASLSIDWRMNEAVTEHVRDDQTWLCRLLVIEKSKIDQISPLLAILLVIHARVASFAPVLMPVP